MEMTGLEIFRYLPGAKKTEHTNCKQCGCPTCMAFALKLAKQNIEFEKCPYSDSELKEKYFHSIKHPQKTLALGNLKIGGENVLYRHEKTFINRTVLAVVVDCSKPEFVEMIKRISRFEIKCVNEFLKVDLIILKNFNHEINLQDLSIQTITYDQFQKLDLDIINDTGFNKTKEYLISTRKKAILEKDDNYSTPVCVCINHPDKYEACARASYYICKYANMIVFDNFDEAMFSTLLRLRQNIFTDPQVSLQVEPGLYEFNSPDKNSIVFLTTNFALTFFAVANELEGIDTPSYLIVIPAEGMSVLTAWSAEKFSANIVAKTLNNLDIRNKINTRKIIIPGLLEHITPELEQAAPDFEFVVGTTEASAISDFVKNLDLSLQ